MTPPSFSFSSFFFFFFPIGVGRSDAEALGKSSFDWRGARSQ